MSDREALIRRYAVAVARLGGQNTTVERLAASLGSDEGEIRAALQAAPDVVRQAFGLEARAVAPTVTGLTKGSNWAFQTNPAPKAPSNNALRLKQ